MDKTLESPIIKVENLSKSFKNFWALKDISFAVKKGEVFGLIGPDGAGKTTLIQILTGLLTPTSGKAYIKNIDVIKEPEKVKEIIGYMPQGLGLNLYDNLSIEENINFFKDLRQIPDHIFQKNKDILLEITKLRPFLKRKVKTLSGGMRQKLALCCTLLHLPDIIFLDEPTTGVDPVSRQDFWEIIYNLVQEREITVLLSTSYMDEAEKCHKIALLYNGELLLEDRPENISNLEEVFIKKISGKKPKSFKKGISKSETIIKCENVSKFFGDFKAVDKVNLEVKRGEIMALLGPNGAGKTTLIKMMCGLLEISEGKILVAGYDVKKEKTKVWTHIGYMSQKFSLYKDLTVLENVKLYAGLYGVKEINLKEVLEKFGLFEYKNSLVKNLPFGIRQRIALICALLHKPLIMFLDEPTSGVDPVIRRSFWEAIYQISREDETTVIVSTHYMDEAENCDRIALMNFGKLIALGSPEELKKKSENISGALIQILTPDFRKVSKILASYFSNLTLYGNKIFIRTKNPEKTEEEIKEILKKERIFEYQISRREIPLQEVFVDFIKKSNSELNV